MIQLTVKLPRKIYIGYSGGIDSSVALHFLSRKHDVTLIHVNHGDEASEAEVPFVVEQAKKFNVSIELHDMSGLSTKGRSKEHFWSCVRKEIFDRKDAPVVLAHHLNDAVETWLLSSIKGQSYLIPKRVGNCVRPFLINPKQKFYHYAARHGVEWIQDASNEDATYAQRNYVRHLLMPHVLELHPGIEKTIKKKYLVMKNEQN